MRSVTSRKGMDVQVGRNAATAFGKAGKLGLAVLLATPVLARCTDDAVSGGVVEPDAGVSVTVNGDVSPDVTRPPPATGTCAETEGNFVTLFPIKVFSEGKEERKNVQNGDTVTVNGVNYTVEAKVNEDGTATVDLVAGNGVKIPEIQDGVPFESHNVRFAEAVVETVDAQGNVAARSVVEVKADQGSLTLAEGEGFKVTGDVVGKDSEGNLLVKVSLFSVPESGAEPTKVEEKEVTLKKGAEVTVGGMTLKVTTVSGEVNGDSACVGETAVVKVDGQRYAEPEGANAQVTGSVNVTVGEVVTDKESQGSGCAEVGATVEGQTVATSLKCTGEVILTRTRTDGTTATVTLDSVYVVDGPQRIAEKAAARAEGQ
ncbi:hypothetical protein HYT84_03935 [Candidatus Micrarchaeota archaeon]|nr:hypothetical protein [Candidatus Micrarchaeota archaeon]